MIFVAGGDGEGQESILTVNAVRACRQSSPDNRAALGARVHHQATTRRHARSKKLFEPGRAALSGR